MAQKMGAAEMPAVPMNYVFCVATYGFLQGFVCEDARRELKRKGITMNAGYSVKMPDNWTPMFDLSDPQKVQQQVNLCTVSRLPPPLPEICYQLQQQDAIPRAIPA